MEERRNEEIQSSYKETCYTGKKCLVLAPHQDDEIHVGGNAIATLLAGGAEVYVLFSTNGDFKLPAATRIREATAALDLLGVKRDHVLYMGYGDAFNSDAHDSMYYCVDGSFTSASGHTETYGAGDYADFAYLSRGEHSKYNRANFLKDLKLAIQWVKADLILCVDYDEHADHRMLSLSFDQVMGEILKEEPSYHPQVLKRFAYPLAYTAEEDYFCLNNPSTVKPVAGKTWRYPSELLDHSMYAWEDRVRLPIADGALARGMSENLIGKALACHVSQFGDFRFAAIMNSDEVYWERRTDNLALGASVSVSSNEADSKYLNDWMLVNATDIDSKVPVFDDYCWKPEDGDREKEIKYTWDEPVKVSQIRLWGRVDCTGEIDKLAVSCKVNGLISLDKQLVVGPVPKSGQPLTIDLGEDHVEALTIRLLETNGDDYGVAEVEVFAGEEAEMTILPFLKIVSGDDFIYEYLLRENEDRLPIGVYGYGAADELKDLNWTVVSGTASFDGNELVLQDGCQKVVLKVTGEVDGRSLYDQVVIRRISREEEKQIMEAMEADKKVIAKLGAKRKRHMYLNKMKEVGIKGTLKKVAERIRK